MVNVEIRRLIQEDAEVSFKWRNNPLIWKFTGNRPDKIVTLDMEKKWIRKILSDPNSLRYAILANGKYIGNVQITGVDWDLGTGELHIFIGDTNYWGKGIGLSATQLLLKKAKKEKLKSLYLYVNPENIAAIKLYQNAGFEFQNTEKTKMQIKW